MHKTLLRLDALLLFLFLAPNRANPDCGEHAAGCPRIFALEASSAEPAAQAEKPAQISEPSLSKNLSFDLDVGYKRINWTPGFRRDILAFETGRAWASMRDDEHERRA